MPGTVAQGACGNAQIGKSEAAKISHKFIKCLPKLFGAASEAYPVIHGRLVVEWHHQQNAGVFRAVR